MSFYHNTSIVYYVVVVVVEEEYIFSPFFLHIHKLNCVIKEKIFSSTPKGHSTFMFVQLGTLWIVHCPLANEIYSPTKDVINNVYLALVVELIEKVW